MGTAFPFVEIRKDSLFFLRVIVRVALFGLGGKDTSPSGLKDLFPAYFKVNIPHFPQNRCRGNFAVGVKSRYETAGDQIIHFPLVVRQVARRDACRYDGMVVRYFRIVKHTLAFGQLDSLQRSGQFRIVNQSVQRGRDFRIDIVAQESRVHTRIRCHFLFI